MEIEKLFRILDGALLARHDEETQHLLVWDGGHGVYIISPKGEATLVSIGAYNIPLTREEAQQVIEEWLETHEYMQLTNWLERGM